MASPEEIALPITPNAMDLPLSPPYTSEDEFEKVVKVGDNRTVIILPESCRAIIMDGDKKDTLDLTQKVNVPDDAQKFVIPSKSPLPAVFSASEMTDPLDAFFLNHCSYWGISYDTNSPTLVNLFQLFKRTGYSRRSDEWQAIDRSFWIAMCDGFHHYYGETINDIRAWKTLWGVMGWDLDGENIDWAAYSTVFDDNCTFINVIDLIDATRGCAPSPPSFTTKAAVKAYSREPMVEGWYPRIFPMWYACGGHMTHTKSITLEKIPGLLGVILGDLKPTQLEIDKFSADGQAAGVNVHFTEDGARYVRSNRSNGKGKKQNIASKEEKPNLELLTDGKAITSEMIGKVSEDANENCPQDEPKRLSTKQNWKAKKSANDTVADAVDNTDSRVPSQNGPSNSAEKSCMTAFVVEVNKPAATAPDAKAEAEEKANKPTQKPTKRRAEKQTKKPVEKRPETTLADKPVESVQDVKLKKPAGPKKNKNNRKGKKPAKKGTLDTVNTKDSQGPDKVETAATVEIPAEPKNTSSVTDVEKLSEPTEPVKTIPGVEVKKPTGTCDTIPNDGAKKATSRRNNSKRKAKKLLSEVDLNTIGTPKSREIVRANETSATAAQKPLDIAGKQQATTGAVETLESEKTIKTFGTPVITTATDNVATGASESDATVPKNIRKRAGWYRGNRNHWQRGPKVAKCTENAPANEKNIAVLPLPAQDDNQAA